MTPLDAMRDALQEVFCDARVDPVPDDAAELIEALNKRNVFLVAVDPSVLAPLSILTRDSGK